jgi:hypothetical protein
MLPQHTDNLDAHDRYLRGIKVCLGARRGGSKFVSLESMVNQSGETNLVAPRNQALLK